MQKNLYSEESSDNDIPHIEDQVNTPTVRRSERISKPKRYENFIYTANAETMDDPDRESLQQSGCERSDAT